MGLITVAALYQFASVSEPLKLQVALKAVCKQEGIKGTLILSSEGINGTVAGSAEGIRSLRALLEKHFNGLEYKESLANKMPFHRLKVLVKPEIVTLGKPDINPIEKVGTYVSPQDWNGLIEDPDVLLIDVRNDYEIQLGSFQGAQNPKTQAFSEFPEFVQHLDKTKHRKVAMCCTGGIRCEKASAYMLSQGFEEVYHLKGGILKYLEVVPPENSLWEGECFVFDGRVSLGHGLATGTYALCHGCRRPLSAEERQSPLFEEGVACSGCAAGLSPERQKAFRERHRQERLAQARGASHIGASMRERRPV